MQDTRFTRAWFKNHLTYSLWKYILLGIVAVGGWNLVFSTTAYKPPKDKQLTVYFVTYAIGDDSLLQLREQIMAMDPTLEQATFVSIVYTPDDNYYGAMQVSTYMGAQEGDVFILSKERFASYRETGAFISLDEAIAAGDLDMLGADTSRYIVVDEEGVRGVAGVPLDAQFGLMALNIDNRDLVMTVAAYSKNIPAAIRFADWLLKTYEAPKPAWVIEMEAATPVPVDAVEEISSY